MKLPPPTRPGSMSVEQAIMQRRTVRAFAQKTLDPDHLSQLLWAASGITGKDHFKRAAPSAGALYPMDVYVLTGQESVAGIQAGNHRYQPREHRLSPVAGGDMRQQAARACFSQMWMADAPIILVITAQYSRITVKYGERGIRYAMIEAGHIGQNIFLQAQAIGLDAGIVGAFDDRKLISVLSIPSAHEPLLLMPVGYRQGL